MKEKQPVASILMPVFNGEKFLAESINSVLAQTWMDFEFIIIDDGSTDNSLEIIRSFSDPRIRLLCNEVNSGLIFTLNKGILQAKGKYIVRHDCDDLMRPDRLRLQISLLEENPGVVLVGSWLQLIDENGVPAGRWRYPETDIGIRWAQLFNSAVSHPSAVYRAEVIQKLGGYDPDFLHAEDYELWARMSMQGKVANIGKFLVDYRVHPESVTSKYSESQLQTRVTIAAKNIADCVGCQLDTKNIKLLIQMEQPSSLVELCKLVHDYQMLLSKFREKFGPFSATVEKNIQLDVVGRITGSFQNLGYFDRVLGLVKCYEYFPGFFWFSGRFVLLLLDDTLKNRLKRWIS